MTTFERLGLLAAECDVAAARATTPYQRAMFKIVAAIHRRKQIACLTKSNSEISRVLSGQMGIGE